MRESVPVWERRYQALRLLHLREAYFGVSPLHSKASEFFRVRRFGVTPADRKSGASSEESRN
jgi:hypothetical protein